VTATHARCGRNFGDNVITIFVLIPTVKKIDNRLIFTQN